MRDSYRFPQDPNIADYAVTDIEASQKAKDIRLAGNLFCLVGIGYLFPFSALTQPVDYWNLLFPDFNIEFPLTTTYMYTNLVMLGLLVVFGGEPSFPKRIIGGFIGQLLVLLFVPTSYFFISTESLNTVAILAATAFAAIATAFLDSAVIALSSQYPLRVQEYFQLGVGVSTLIGSIYRDFTKLAFPSDEVVESSMTYFYSGAATIVLCILAYNKLRTLPLLENDPQSARRIIPEQSLEFPTEASLLVPSDPGTVDQASVATLSKLAVLKKIWYNELMVTLTFMSTLALWPPLITEIPSYSVPKILDWWPLILLTAFSFMDCVGRILVRFRLGLNRDNIWIAVVLRFLLFPLLLCSVKGFIFTHDFFSVLFVVLLGWSNGYVGTMAIILVNDCLDTTAEQSVAGTFTSFALNCGLVFGATIGSEMEKLILG